jgi:hypothetical protein
MASHPPFGEGRVRGINAVLRIALNAQRRQREEREERERLRE